MRLIDADTLTEELKGAIERNHEYHMVVIDSDFETLIDDAPTIDAVQVVRCKDCFMHDECKAAVFYGDNGYCSVGDKK